MFSWPQKIRVLVTFILNSHSTITGKRGRAKEFIITAAFIPKTRFGCFWQVVLQLSWQEADRLCEFPFKRSFRFLRKTHAWTIQCELQMCAPLLLLCPPGASTLPWPKLATSLWSRKRAGSGIGKIPGEPSASFISCLTLPDAASTIRIGGRPILLCTTDYNYSGVIIMTLDVAIFNHESSWHT